MDLNRKLLSEHFKGTALQVLEASNGRDAVEIAVRENPALILMDIRMPGLDGYGATKSIREHTKLEMTPIIALTGSTMADETTHYNKQGFVGALRKPIERALLFELIEDFLPVRMKEEADDDLSAASVNTEPSGVKVNAECELKVLDELRNGIWSEWEAIKDSGDISRIREFAEHLYSLADISGAESLALYAEKTLNLVAQFDLQGLNSQLASYPDLVDQLEN